MADLAIIEGGVVVNRIVGPDGFPGAVSCSAFVGIGWAFVEGEFVPPAVPDPSAPTADDVDRERDRRIDSGFAFGGAAYQSRESDRENIAGASTAALGAMVGGALPGDFRWHGGAADFVWIAADNSEITLDAQTMFALGQAAMNHKTAHIFAGRALKDEAEIPTDYTDDAYWP